MLVTGAAGFIGSHVARRLLESGRSVVGLDSMNAYYDPALKQARLKELQGHASFRFFKLDLADRAGVAALFAAEKFPYVVHLAAQAGVRYSLEDPHAYVDANIEGFINVLEGCRHNGCRHLLYASSSSVYGANTRLPFSTADNVDHPISLYAASKKANELMAHCLCASVPAAGDGAAVLHGLRAVGPPRHGDVDLHQGDHGRPADPAVQPRQDAARLHLCRRRGGVGGPADRKARGGRSVMVRRQAGSVAQRRALALYNIGNNQPTDVPHVVDLLEKALGRTAPREMLPMQPGDVPATYADVDDLMRDVGFRPSTPIADGVARFVAWYRDYHKV